jgi:hypothetical protein
MKNFVFTLSLCLLLPTAASFAETRELNEREALDRYYTSVYLGEMKTPNYFGPLDPRATFNDETGDLSLLDDQFKSAYLNERVQSEAFDLNNFWFRKVVDKSNCPDVTLGENLDYVRYLFRLLSISYLFEGIKLNNKAAKEISAGKNICSISFDDVFGKCSPRSDDMKKFHERAQGKFANDFSKIYVAPLGKKELADWYDNFQHTTSLTIDPVFARLHDWCHAERKNCRNLSPDEIKKALNSICSDDRDLIQKLCSEKDSLYGVSNAEKATELIQTSNAFNLINHNGMGEECLRRYVKVFTPKETRFALLGKLFPLIHASLLRSNSRFPQGELFLPGALKEFDQKGLSDFLAALKPPKVEVVAVVMPKPKAKPKPKPPVIAVKKPEAPKPEPVKMEIPEPPKPKVSEFESRLAELESKKLESLSINMETFRDDFEFTQQMLTDLAAPIKKFQTRTALTDMKSFDNLGSSEAPVGLIFLKYLIDTDNHQGLYNIITVLGDKFYVNNDIEKKDKPVFIEIRNDATTKNKWQIILLQSPKNKNKK